MVWQFKNETYFVMILQDTICLLDFEFVFLWGLKGLIPSHKQKKKNTTKRYVFVMLIMLPVLLSVSFA